VNNSVKSFSTILAASLSSLSLNSKASVSAIEEHPHKVYNTAPISRSVAKKQNAAKNSSTLDEIKRSKADENKLLKQLHQTNHFNHDQTKDSNASLANKKSTTKNSKPNISKICKKELELIDLPLSLATLVNKARYINAGKVNNYETYRTSKKNPAVSMLDIDEEKYDVQKKVAPAKNYIVRTTEGAQKLKLPQELKFDIKATRNPLCRIQITATQINGETQIIEITDPLGKTNTRNAGILYKDRGNLSPVH
jgi:hypothetical protein